MEPMTLGSPTGSPIASTNSSGFLPAYLMGETNVSTTPRNNTLSPTKGRPMAFAHTPNGIQNSPADFHNRSMLQQKQFGLGHNSPAVGSQMNNQNNTSISGPPTQSLFDSLRASNNPINTPPNQYNESYLFNDFNQSRILSPIPYDLRNNNNINNTLNNTPNGNPMNLSNINDISQQQHQQQQQQQQHHLQYQNMNGNNTPLSSMKSHAVFWITVYGFPQSATSIILSHFSQCGTIVDKIFAPQNGNWIHLRFSSKLECDKALNYHERIISNGLMIGVTYCKDTDIMSKEINERNLIPTNRVRPLNHTAYQSAQSLTEVAQNSPTPKQTSGLVNKAMDIIFGW